MYLIETDHFDLSSTWVPDILNSHADKKRDIQTQAALRFTGSYFILEKFQSWCPEKNLPVNYFNRTKWSELTKIYQWFGKPYVSNNTEFWLDSIQNSKTSLKSKEIKPFQNTVYILQVTITVVPSDSFDL